MEEKVIPSDSSFELDETDTQDEILVKLQCFVDRCVDGFYNGDGFVVAAALAHDERSSSDCSDTLIDRAGVLVAVE